MEFLPTGLRPEDGFKRYLQIAGRLGIDSWLTLPHYPSQGLLFEAKQLHWPAERKPLSGPVERSLMVPPRARAQARRASTQVWRQAVREQLAQQNRP